MNRWPSKPFREIFKLKQGKYLAKDEMMETPREDWTVPVYGANGIIGYTNRSMYDRPVPLVSCRGANCGVAHLTLPKSWISNNSIACVSDEADPRFFFHVFRNTSFADVTGGSAQPQITLSSLGPKQIVCPPLETQRRIASILGAYDDLIEVNRRRIAVLEEMARGLFEEWFVRFRFPGHENVPIHDRPDGPLPEGWNWTTFGQLVAEIRQPVTPADVAPDTTYVGLEHLPRRSTTLAECGRADEVSSLKLMFKRGDILFGKIRPYFHKVVWVPKAGVCSSDAIVWRPKMGNDGLALAIASSDAFVFHATQTSNGTKMPRANPSVLAAYKCPSPPKALGAAFNRSVLPMVELAAALQEASRRLAASRDLLLPRLIFGELSVDKAESELERAA